VPLSINIGLDGQYASWAGTLLTGEERLIVVASSKELADEAVMRLARVGLENVAGVLEGGIDAWRAAGLPVAALEEMGVGELRSRLAEWTVLDVRRPAEHQAGHVPGSANVPLATLGGELPDLDRSRPLAVICASGYRSSIAASILRRHSYDVRCNVAGGTLAWVAAGYETEAGGGL
jgi:hydroxyacylglutathione hydrolase